jgi:hypothetical protein
MGLRINLFFKILLSIAATFLIVYQSTVIINRVGSDIAFGHKLVYVSDLVSLIFILILININVKVGTLLYLSSFVFYVLAQLLFVPDISPVDIIASSIFRAIAVIVFFSLWRDDIKLGQRARQAGS